MKKGLLILVTLIVATSMFAFVKGTINPGGYVSFSSTKNHSDGDPITSLTIAPQVGYFVIDNLAVDLMLNLSTASQSGTGYKDSETDLGFGLGGRYFYNNFYGGLGLMYKSINAKYEEGNDTDKYKLTAMYLVPKAGYVLPMARNVYVDLGVSYTMGLGKIGDDNPAPDADNEYSSLQFMAGLQIFYPSVLK